MPVPLPLPSPPTLRLPQCPHPNLVPLLHSDLPKRPGMAGPPDASRGSRLPAAGQLLPLGCRLTKAQRLLDRQLKTRWPKLLNGIARQLNPIHAEIFHKHPISYYWSTYQHEWAIDVVFHHAADLRRFYPRWVNHAMTTFSSPDFMRFLGKHLTLNGQISQKFSGEVISDFKRRAEGVRVKHSVNRNSVKLYDKAYTPQASVLRAEATIHNGDDFRVYRRKEGDRKGRMAWRPLRRGLTDLHRRSQLCD